MKLRATLGTHNSAETDEISKQTIKTLIILENKWLQMTRWRKKGTIDEWRKWSNESIWKKFRGVLDSED